MEETIHPPASARPSLSTIVLGDIVALGTWMIFTPLGMPYFNWTALPTSTLAVAIALVGLWQGRGLSVGDRCFAVFLALFPFVVWGKIFSDVFLFE